MLPRFRYARPSSVEEAVRLLSADGARASAGGSDLLGCLRDGVFEASAVVSLSNLAELRGIERARGRVRIGALTSVADVAANPMLQEQYTALTQAAGSVA
ncbi:MAG: FAD binding domain-containing protein, partial [Gemmatimonadales bacterium]